MTENTQHELPLEEHTASDAQEEIHAESAASAAESEVSAVVIGEIALAESEATADTITAEALYGDDAQVAALAERVMMVAPWVDYKLGGQWQQMTKKEVSLVIRRCMALGVDPLNDKEVHIWHGKHGVNFQLAYTLIAQWVRNMKGGHTEPRFTDLTPDEKELHGLADNDQATRASLVMLSDIPNIIALSQAGFSPEEAREHFTVTGLGTVKAEDWASPYFAPNGRSKRWKLQKRALTDADRRRLGEPSRQEIHVLRRQRGDVLLLPEDFDGTDHLLPVDRANLALAHAQARTQAAVPTGRDPDQILAKGRRLLRGDPDDRAGIQHLCALPEASYPASEPHATRRSPLSLHRAGDG